LSLWFEEAWMTPACFNICHSHLHPISNGHLYSSGLESVRLSDGGHHLVFTLISYMRNWKCFSPFFPFLPTYPIILNFFPDKLCYYFDYIFLSCLNSSLARW
jgi:hypothetical protein